VDEKAQRPADGKCLAFGSQNGVDYVVAEAGDIYDNVHFTRSVALIEDELVLFVDQIRCDSEHLLDVAYHNRGVWDALPDGTSWTPPDKPGYEYLRDATIRKVEDGIDLFIQMAHHQRKSISIAGDETVQVITATGLEKHTEDRAPMIILRRHARETAFVWCVGLDGQAAKIELLPVLDSSGNTMQTSVAAAVHVETADGQKWVVVANPDGLSLNVALPDGTKCSTEAPLEVLRP
jgi:hypothetical protein